MRLLFSLVLFIICLSEIRVNCSPALYLRNNSSIQTSPILVNESNHSFLLHEPRGPNCPFSGAWLANVDLFLKSKVVVSDTLIEKVTFRIFRDARTRYWISNHRVFYVNHMSQFEHCIRRKNFTSVMFEFTCLSHAQSAEMGECNVLELPNSNVSKQTLVVMPFYPGKWNGHSTTNADVKSHWGMATLCSTLRYFGSVVVGTLESMGNSLELLVSCDSFDEINMLFRITLNTAYYKTFLIRRVYVYCCMLYVVTVT